MIPPNTLRHAMLTSTQEYIEEKSKMLREKIRRLELIEYSEGLSDVQRKTLDNLNRDLYELEKLDFEKFWRE